MDYDNLGIDIITELANQTIKKQYPTMGENHFNKYDTAVILQSYFVLAEYLEKQKSEVSTQIPVQKQLSV